MTATVLTGAQRAKAADSVPHEQLPWIAYGDLRGNIEPCGCDPVSDLGGFKRIATVIARERLAEPQLLIFDLGNDLPEGAQAGDLPRIDAVTAAQRAINPTAILFNNLEIARAESPQFSFPQLPYLLSNAIPTGLQQYKRGVVKTSIITSRAVIIGYVAPTNDVTRNRVEPLSGAMIQQWRALLGLHTPLAKVLLFSGSDEDLATITKANIFDIVIASNKSPVGTLPVPTEKNDPTLLLRNAKDAPTIWQVPFAGQGLLRGGVLQSRPVPSISGMLDACGGLGKTCAKNSLLTPNPATLTLSDPITWLDRRYDDPISLKNVFREYNQSRAREFAKTAAQERKQSKASKYVGAEACATCHPAASKIWQKSRHHQAYTTLKEKGKDLDRECVSCHVVGLGAGGFVTINDSAHLAGVQCESCHGPSRDHAAVPTTKTPNRSPKEQCVGCHHPPHSMTFKLEENWSRIIHGK